MPSKLELVCAQFRESAAEAEAAATASSAAAERAAAAGRLAAGALQGSSRRDLVVGRYEAGAARLREAAASLAVVADRAYGFAADICGRPLTGIRLSAAPRTPTQVVLDPVGAPHGGHGGSAGHAVPPAQTPIEDISRERISQLIGAGGVDRPEDLPPGLVALRMVWIERGGHAGLRHDATQVDDQALQDRCTHGHDPVTGSRVDWEHGGDHGYGRDATTFTTPEALVFAEARIWESPEMSRARAIADTDQRPYCRGEVDAADVLGTRFAEYLRGFERTGSKANPTGARAIQFPIGTQIVFSYRRSTPGGPWYLWTMFPRRP